LSQTSPFHGLSSRREITLHNGAASLGSLERLQVCSQKNKGTFADITARFKLLILWHHLASSGLSTSEDLRLGGTDHASHLWNRSTI
jgi:hypothetical protein